MCGIVAVSGSKDIIHDIYESLTVLQHRVQDASGILTNHNGKIKRALEMIEIAKKLNGVLKMIANARNPRRKTRKLIKKQKWLKQITFFSPISLAL